MQEWYADWENAVIEEPDEDDSDGPERIVRYKRWTNSLPRQS